MVQGYSVFYIQVVDRLHGESQITECIAFLSTHVDVVRLPERTEMA